MATLTHGYAAPHVSRGFAAVAFDAASDAVRRAARAWEVRRDVQTVSGLSDAALADIGIGRGFEEEAVRHGRGRRSVAGTRVPSPALMAASWTEWR